MTTKLDTGRADKLLGKVRIKDGAIVGQDMGYFIWKDNGEIFEAISFGISRAKLIADGYGIISSDKKGYGNGALYVNIKDLILCNKGGEMKFDLNELQRLYDACTPTPWNEIEAIRALEEFIEKTEGAFPWLIARVKELEARHSIESQYTTKEESMNACENDKCRVNTNKVNDDLCPECRKKTEWVAVLHGQSGTVKIAYLNARALAVGLEDQTAEGWMVARVYQRVAETYAEEAMIDLEKLKKDCITIRDDTFPARTPNQVTLIGKCIDVLKLIDWIEQLEEELTRMKGARNELEKQKRTLEAENAELRKQVSCNTEDTRGRSIK